MEWYWHVLEVVVGSFLGVFVMALCTLGRCSDCETIGRIWRGEKNET